MKEIKCLQDVQLLQQEGNFPRELLNRLEEDLKIIHEWVDVDEEYSFTEFHSDDFGNGRIAIIEQGDGDEKWEEIGISEGIDSIVPETVDRFTMDGEKWVRLLVIYNDSYSMFIWVPECMGGRFR